MFILKFLLLLSACCTMSLNCSTYATNHSNNAHNNDYKQLIKFSKGNATPMSQANLENTPACIDICNTSENNTTQYESTDDADEQNTDI